MSTFNMALPSRTPSNVALTPSSARVSRGSLMAEKGSLSRADRDTYSFADRFSTSTSNSSIVPLKRTSTQNTMITPLAFQNIPLEGYDIQE